MPITNAFLRRATTPNLRTQITRFAGGGAAANMSKVSGSGITSIVYVSTGLYTVTFAEVGSAIRNAQITVHTVAAGAPRVAKLNLATLSLPAKTCQLEVWDMATPSLVDLATTASVDIQVDWAPSSLPVAP